MTNKTILDDVHETAKGLHKAGPMGATTMREFDAQDRIDLWHGVSQKRRQLAGRSIGVLDDSEPAE